jgi:protein-S-isoprenylcysteine O-methyltransferase Ste14
MPTMVEGGGRMTELAFRLVSLAAAVTYMTTRTVYERRLGRPSKREQMRTASPRDRRGLIAVAYGMLPMWLYMLSPWLDFAAMGLPAAVRFAGLALVVLGIVALAWSHRDLAENWSPFVEKPGGGRLITGGVYRLVRHPMYLSFLLFNVGMWLLTSNWVAGAPAVAGFLVFYLTRVDHEERMMLELFGEEYRGYAVKTGRILPLLGRGRLAGERTKAA